jgi:hypothetical protein
MFSAEQYRAKAAEFKALLMNAQRTIALTGSTRASCFRLWIEALNGDFLGRIAEAD